MRRRLYRAVLYLIPMKTFIIALITALLVSALALGLGYYIFQSQLNSLQQDIDQIENSRPIKPNQLNNENPTNTATPDTKNSELTNTTTPNPANNEISKHAVFVTSSEDPNNFPDVSEATFLKGSVPEAVALTQTSAAGNAGDVLVYFPSFENLTQAGSGSENMVLAKSTDGGKTWSDQQAISITDKANEGGLVDPSVVQLDDGRIRMYYFGPYFAPGTTPSDPAKAEGNHTIYSIISDDGINFTGETGERFAAEKLTDPEVIYHQGRWLMYYSLGQTTGIASSTDGLTFEKTEFSWNGGGIPGAYVDPANYVHLYGCKQNAIMTVSSVDGVTFDDEPVTALSSTDTTMICDPSPVRLADGIILMIYKKIVE